MMEVTKEFEFCAAHFLPGHKVCGEMHGHNYRVLVTFAGDDTENMLIDFKDIKTRVAPILELLDHSTLNNVILYPTAENIAKYIFNSLVGHDRQGEDCSLNSVTIYETPTSFVRYTPPS